VQISRERLQQPTSCPLYAVKVRKTSLCFLCFICYFDDLLEKISSFIRRDSVLLENRVSEGFYGKKMTRVECSARAICS